MPDFLASSINRIAFVDRHQFIEAVERVLETAPLERGAAKQLAKHVEDRLRQGAVLPSATLARVIAESRSLTLYRMRKSEILRSEDALIVLYKNDFCHREVENALVSAMWERTKQEPPVVSHILSAIGKYGSQNVLSSLATLREELMPGHLRKLSVARATDESLGNSNESLLTSLSARASGELIRNLDNAIEAIQNRATRPANLEFDPVEFGDRVYGLPESFMEHYEEAKEKVGSPRDSVKAIREAAEALSRHVYGMLRAEGVPVSGDIPRKLEVLIQQLASTRQVPETLLACLVSFQKIGNVSHHPVEGGNDYLTESLNEALLMMLDEVLMIYEEWADGRRTAWEESL